MRVDLLATFAKLVGPADTQVPLLASGAGMVAFALLSAYAFTVKVPDHS